MKSVILLLGCLAGWQVIAQEQPFNLMPVPREVKPNGEKLRVDRRFELAIQGHPEPRLYAETSRMIRRLSERTGLFLKQGFITDNDHATTPALLLKVNRPGQLKLYENETYQLVIRQNQAVIRAETELGAIRGLETLLQLLSRDADGYYLPGVLINDEPRFPWRGLLLDVGCHFMPMEVIKRTLDGMAAVKMNVLHLHLSEDQGFRVESKAYPKLHEKGSDGVYFTQEEVRQIIRYAGQRGIRVVPEFGVPGHTTAMLVAYPELASVPGKYVLERYFGVFDPALDPTNERVYGFLDTLFTEMTQLFPDDYFHIGGDENTGKDWDKSPRIQAYMKKHHLANNSALQTEFNKRVLKILQQKGKKMMGWDEILQPGVPKDIVIQSWRGREALYESAKKGYQGLLSTGYYIDLIQPTDYHYLNDPIPADTPLTESQKKYILGGEATMWSEHVTPETVDSRIWPRTAAIAERLWSPGTVKDVDELYRRLDIISLQLESLGLLHLKNKPMMMRRLANSEDTEALEVLVDVIEPLKIYERNQGDTMYTVFSPYTKIADVATPDQRVARHFRNDVHQYCLAPTPALEKELMEQLIQWQANHGKLMVTIARSPVLAEVESLSEQLSQIAGVGIEAVGYIRDKQKAPADWEKKSLVTTEKAKEQGGRCELQVVTAIEELIQTAAKKN